MANLRDLSLFRSPVCRILSLTAQLQKSFQNGFFYSSLAYTYTRSEDLFAGTSSQNHSNFYRVPTVNGSENVEVGFSSFDVRSRIVGMVSCRKEYLGNLDTTFSMFSFPFKSIISIKKNLLKSED